MKKQWKEGFECWKRWCGDQGREMFPTITLPKAKMSVVLEFAQILWGKCLPCDYVRRGCICSSKVRVKFFERCQRDEWAREGCCVEWRNDQRKGKKRSWGIVASGIRSSARGRTGNYPERSKWCCVMQSLNWMPEIYSLVISEFTGQVLGIKYI